MKYIVYKTTNNVNGKIYVGVHKTENHMIFDGYLGSGIHLRNSIKKHGTDVFSREVLHIFNTQEEAYHKESEIVNDEFVKSNNTYNTALGGKLGDAMYGWDNVNKSPNRTIISNNHSEFMSGETNPMYGTVRKDHSTRMSGAGNSFYGKPHSNDAKLTISTNRKGKGVGVNNSMFKGWIHTPSGKFATKKDAKLATGLGDRALNNRLYSDKFNDFWIE